MKEKKGGETDGFATGQFRDRDEDPLCFKKSEFLVGKIYKYIYICIYVNM